MAPSATSGIALVSQPTESATLLNLRNILTAESAPLARRFRALFSLKHLASQRPATPQTIAAIQAIAAAFDSPSALLKHELAYCLGQTRNLNSTPYLRKVLQDRYEDPMCRHEAAEALGALGDMKSLDLLKIMKNDEREVDVVRETCDIAVQRIEWENSQARRTEKLKCRFVDVFASLLYNPVSDHIAATLHRSTPLPLYRRQLQRLQYPTYNLFYSTPGIRSFNATVQCSPSETLPPHPIYPLQFPPCML